MEDLPPLDAFDTLIFQVAGQQLSVAATRAIIARIEQRFEGHLPSPAELLAADPHALRESGMSNRKGETLRALAQRFLDGELSDEAFARMTDEEIEAALTALMGELNPYKGQVLVLSSSPWGGIGVQVQRLPAITREQIVFPDGVLERIERHTKTFSEHAEQLRAAGRHMKRGLLLHGPPGTGKTLTVMYLSALMPERTTLLLTGQALGAVGPACEMARELAPAMLVMEDVDLVAENRTQGRPTTILFEMLNQLDGLNEDVDVIFVLTTNRPEVVEPALASRPGRVDLAIRMPLPDDRGRARLLALYGQGLQLALDDETRFIATTANCTPAFIREALRRAALLALERGDHNRITDSVLSQATSELRDSADEMTGRLLGDAIEAHRVDAQSSG